MKCHCTFPSYILYLFVTCITLLSACRGNDERSTQRNVKKVLYGMPVPISNSPYTLIPVRVINSKYIADSYYLDEEEFAKVRNDAHNYVVYNKVTKKSKLLVEEPFERMDFRTISIDEKDRDGNLKGQKKYLLYRVIREDYNKDGVINWRDEIILYVSDLSGSNFKPITPERCKVIDWHVDPAHGNLYVRLLYDRDRNYNFDLRDDAIIMVADIAERKAETPYQINAESASLIQREDRQSIEALLLTLDNKRNSLKAKY